MFKLIQVDPHHKDWQYYLAMSAVYFKENWPDLFLETIEETEKAYDKKLREGINQGGRGLFFAENEGEYVGNANVYLARENGDVWLNIAEFYILPAKRRASLGTKFYEALCAWGKSHHAMSVKLEVSKNKVDANNFWAELGFKLISSDAKNLYVTRF